MVAFTDLPKLTCVRMTAVSTVHSGKGTSSRCESAKLNTAAIVTLRASPSWLLCSQTSVRNAFHCVAMRLMVSSRCKAGELAVGQPICRSHYIRSSLVGNEEQL